MKIVVSEIPEEGLDLQEEEALEGDTGGVVSGARLHLHVQKTNSEVLLRGDITARLNLVCGRCLKDFSRDVSIAVDLAYHPIDELRAEDKYELSPGELNTGFYRNDELDLHELSKEQALLQIPMKPLCSEACKGICPVCGADLNETACGCRAERPQSGLTMLDKFLKGGKE